MARKSRKTAVLPESAKKVDIRIWHAALYIRLSVEFNGKRGDSLETQRQIMEAHLALFPDIEVAQIYTDNGISGQTFERPAFQKMLQDVEAGKINCIVTKDLSRLGRNVIDTGYYIEKYFPLHHVRFIAVNDQYDSESTENGGNHLIIPLKNMINEAYVADISKKVRAQKRQAMRDGEFVGPYPPYGYKKAPDNCHKLIINEDTAPVVRQIFECAADGVPIYQIVRQLNEAKILTPGCYSASLGIKVSPQQRGSGSWTAWTVTKILKHQVYAGDLVQGKHNCVKHKQIPAKEDDWIVVQNTHEPIVSRELYEKVQAVLQQTSRKRKLEQKNSYTENILRGRIFCGCCGKHLHRERSFGVYLYRCISNQRIRKDFCTGYRYVTEKELFHVILTIIRQEAETVTEKRLLIEQCSNKMAVQKKQADRELSELMQKAERVRTLISGLYEHYMTGVLTRAEYFEMKENYSRQLHDLTERVQVLQATQNTLVSEMKKYVSLTDRLAEVDENTELSALLVDQLIDRITVNGPDDVFIQFRFANDFASLKEMMQNE